MDNYGDMIVSHSFCCILDIKIFGEVHGYLLAMHLFLVGNHYLCSDDESNGDYQIHGVAIQ